MCLCWRSDGQRICTTVWCEYRRIDGDINAADRDAECHDVTSWTDDRVMTRHVIMTWEESLTLLIVTLSVTTWRHKLTIVSWCDTSWWRDYGVIDAADRDAKCSSRRDADLAASTTSACSSQVTRLRYVTTITSKRDDDIQIDNLVNCIINYCKRHVILLLAT